MGYHNPSKDPQRDCVFRPIIEEAKRQGVSGFNLADASLGGVIFMPHGVSAEEKSFKTGEPNVGLVKGILAPGPAYYEEGLKFTDKIRMVGWAKSDILFSDKWEEGAMKLKKELKLPYEKTILWADMYFPLPLDKLFEANPKRIIYLKETVSALEKLEVNLVIKPHFWGGGFDVKKEWKFPSVRWINPHEYPNVMIPFFFSDMLICDYHSSVSTEFMITGKPVVIQHDMDHIGYQSYYKHIGCYRFRGENSDFPEEDYPAMDLRLWEDWEEYNLKMIEQCLKGKDELLQLREKHVEKVVYKPDGHTAERAVDAIKDLMGR